MTTRIAHRIGRSLLGFSNFLLPKKRRAVIVGVPGYAPNAIAISNALVDHTDLPTIHLLEDDHIPAPASLRTPRAVGIARRRSIRGLWILLRSKYVFLTHGGFLAPRSPRRQIIVQMWHGMPTKRIGALLGERIPNNYDVLLAAGPHWVPILSHAFEVPASRIAVTGLPGSDLIHEADGAARSRLAGIARREEDHTIVLWLPTFRQSIRGRMPTDGVERGNPIQVPSSDLLTIDEALRAADVTALVKTHPLAPRYELGDLQAIRFITDEDLARTGLDLYTALGASDGLITDVSSVWVDFLVADKPMLFFMPDLEEYESSRGLTTDDYVASMPGPVTTTTRALCDLIPTMFGREYAPCWDRERRTAHNIATEAGTALRLLQAIGIATQPPGHGPAYRRCGPAEPTNETHEP